MTTETFPDEHLQPQDAAPESHGTAHGSLALTGPENPADYVHLVVAGPAKASERYRSSLEKDWRKQREAILELPSNEEGLNIERVDAFCQDLGLPERDLRVLDPEDFQKAMRIAKAPEAERQGKYLGHLGVVLVKRDPELEALNGPGFIESRIVHERTHARTQFRSEVEVSQRRSLLVRRMSATLLRAEGRLGFNVSKSSEDKVEGAGIEEGVAVLNQGKYIEEKLGLPYGFAGKNNRYDTEQLGKYTYLTRNGPGEVTPVTQEGSLAAATLELLSKHDPELSALLNSTHVTDGEPKELTRHIDRFMPGLYQIMMDLDINTQQLEWGALFALLSQTLKQQP